MTSRPNLKHALQRNSTKPCCYLVIKLCPSLFATLGSLAHPAPLSMGFTRQEYWSWLPFSSPEDLLNPRSDPASPALTGGLFTTKEATERSPNKA